MAISAAWPTISKAISQASRRATRCSWSPSISMRIAPIVSLASNGDFNGCRTTESLATTGAAVPEPCSNVLPAASTMSTCRTSELRATPSITSCISGASCA